MMATADLCDDHRDAVRVLVGGFASYGAVGAFRGPISTLDVFEDNSLVRDALEEPGDGRVLMVAGAGSDRAPSWAGILARWLPTTAGLASWWMDASATPRSFERHLWGYVPVGYVPVKVSSVVAAIGTFQSPWPTGT